MQRLAPLTFLVLGVTPIVGAQQATDAQAAPPAVDAALAAGAKLLVQLQEHYVPDRRAPRMRDSEVPQWQEGERKRLAKLRAEAEQPKAEWPYEGVYRVRGTIPPGYRVGGSAIVCQALVLAPGYGKDKARQAAVERAIDFMLYELTNNQLLAPGPKRGYDVRGWAHTYALEFFLLALRQDVLNDKRRAAVEKMLPHLFQCLKANETPGGGWNYANSRCSPFMTGSTLLALFQAKKQGYSFDEGMVDRALTALERARLKTGSYVYSGQSRPQNTGSPNRRRRRSSTRNAMPAACARAAIAELCLMKGGRSDAKRVRVAIDGFFEHWGELLKRKSQQGTHVGPYGIAPYYFMYGHTYAALAIEALPESDRPELRKKMQATLWKTREADGGWNDRIFPRSKSYSTAMAMWALLAPRLAPVPTWETK